MRNNDPRASEARYLRYMPAMRSAYIERFVGGPRAVTFYTHEEYLDPALIDPAFYRCIGRLRLIRTVLRGEADVLAIPEPFWVSELPYTTLLALAARISGLWRARHVDVVTYAIENSDPAILLGLPEWIPRRIRRAALSIATAPVNLTLDRIAFGTADARDTYLSGLNSGLARRLGRRSLYFPPLSPACECMEAASAPATGTTVLFLGPLAERKGLPRLLAAWPLVQQVRPDARLIVCGSGVLQDHLDEAITADPTISQVRGASRARIHELLRAGEVLVSLPRPERRWKEQIGLSIPEGIAHGCHIVTTDETGIRDWLSSHHQTVVAVDSPAVVAEAIVQALDHPQPVLLASLPAVSGRAAAEWWMFDGEVRQ